MSAWKNDSSGKSSSVNLGRGFKLVIHQYFGAWFVSFYGVDDITRHVLKAQTLAEAKVEGYTYAYNRVNALLNALAQVDP